MQEAPATVTINITSRWNAAEILFSAQIDASIPVFGRIRAAVRIAIESGANLSDADLRGADLRDADLSDANLRGANLSDADLRDANLRGADLRGADLRDADLSDANLRGANLSGADLRGADLSDADLRDADLSDADLRGADLRGANLQLFKQDLIAEILRMPNELEELRAAIVGGKIDGSTYTGECSCLAGTLVMAHGVTDFSGDSFMVGTVKFTVDAASPREQWFGMIRPGHTPDTNQASKFALEWVDEAIAIRDAIRATAAVGGV